MLETGSPDFGVVNLDNVVIQANAQLHGNGTRAAASGSARHGASARRPSRSSARSAMTTSTRSAPHLAIKVGGVTVAAANLSLVIAPRQATGFAGTIVVGAPRAAVAALVPRIDLPGDVALSVSAKTGSDSIIPVEIAGSVGEASVKSWDPSIDLEHTRITGQLSTNEIDAAELSRGKVIATGAITATFDLQRRAGNLPTAKATITGHGTYQTIPRAEFTASLESHRPKGRDQARDQRTRRRRTSRPRSRAQATRSTSTTRASAR